MNEKLREIELENHRYKLYLDLDMPHQYEIYTQGIWEPIVTQQILDRLKPGNTFVDVGACMGYHTLLASSIVGTEGKVVAFEPDPWYFATLVRNVGINGFSARNRLIREAVSDTVGESFMVTQKLEGRYAAERIPRLVLPGEDNPDKLPVKTCTLDSILKDEVNFIKIDVEGAELQVFKGMRETVENNLDLTIICEIHGDPAPIRAFAEEELGLVEVWLGLTYWGFT